MRIIKNKYAIWLTIFWLGLFFYPSEVHSQLSGELVTVPPHIFSDSISQSELLIQKVIIVDSPGRKAKEFKDTTIAVNTELQLYASLYNNGKYKSEAKVDWFWADTLNSVADTARYLGFGSSIIFKSTKAGAGFIFVKNLPQAVGDSTGTIRVFTREQLRISSVSSSHPSVTQGQQNVPASFTIENLGDAAIIVQEANLQFLHADSHMVNSQYSLYRIDTTTVIQIGQIRTIEFLVDVHSDADTGWIFLKPQLMTRESFYEPTELTYQWQVQTPPRLSIDRIIAMVDEVFPGQEEILVNMHVANQGGATVGDVLAALTFWHNGQDISEQYDFSWSEANPRTIAGGSSVQLQFFVRVKPQATYGSVVINGKISAQDVNTAAWYFDEGADQPASWLVKQTLVQVGIVSTRVNCPHVDVLGNGIVNLNQTFFVEVVIKNQGTDDVRQIAVALQSDGESRFLAPATQMIDLLPKFQGDTLRYPLQAQAIVIPMMENFTAHIDSATTITGANATIIPAFDSLAQVKILNPANLILKLDQSSITAPINRIFEVTAAVTHPDETAGFDSSGTLAIQLPANYELLSGKSEQPFVEKMPVNWKIRAPSRPSGPDTIIVWINRIPHDQNDPSQLAEVGLGAAIFVSNILDASVKIADIAIVEPAGARDAILSTGQWFQVRAKLETQLVDNISMHLTPPGHYEIMDNALKLLVADSATWLLRAPAEPTLWREPISLSAWGTVQQDTTPIVAPINSSLLVQTIARANLKVVAEIIDPPSAAQGRILPGLIFKIRGEVLNLGKAGMYGSCTLFLDVQDKNNFKLLSDTTFSIENGPAIWTVQAAEKLDAIPRIFKVWLQEIPYDENSDEEAYVSNENQVADVQVYTTILNSQLMVRQVPPIDLKAIAAGGTARMMGIEFAFFNTELGFPIRIHRLKFDVEDLAGSLLSPQSVVAGCRILDDQHLLGEAASISSNPVDIQFLEPICLDANQQQQIWIEIDFAENLHQPFRLNLKDTSYLGLQAIAPVTIVDEFKNPIALLNLRSACPVVIENDLKKSFRNYPNPFGTPDRPRTHFIYYLTEDCSIELKIYTLLGELVWSCAFDHTDRQGKRGLHQENDLTWDGRNQKGLSVLNGVYIAKIKTSTGESAQTKIAVIK
ncbi:MAG: hypothetical protein ONB27_08990 [candidate division KSB1 bacterium]|nr:hypothetical protein [candidate division KSB1 bacterium]